MPLHSMRHIGVEGDEFVVIGVGYLEGGWLPEAIDVDGGLPVLLFSLGVDDFETVVDS